MSHEETTTESIKQQALEVARGALNRAANTADLGNAEGWTQVAQQAVTVAILTNQVSGF